VYEVVWSTRDRAEVYVREAMSKLFVQLPIRYGSAVTFETVANERDVYEVRAFITTREAAWYCFGCICLYVTVCLYVCLFEIR